MTKALAALRTVALLLGIWAVLLLVGHFAGVLPSFPWSLGGDDDEAPAAPDAGVDAGVAEAPPEPEAPAAPPPVDAGAPSAEPAPEPVGETWPSYVACAEGATAPTLARVTVLGDRPALVVGCGRETTLFAIEPSADGVAPVRVATFRLRTDALRGEPEGAAVVSADVSGDGRVDLVFGHLVPASRNAAQQGALDFLPRDEHGAFEPSTALAPIAVASLAAGDLDGAAGDEIVALHQADRFGRRASEAWVFGGGSAPARTTRLDAGVTARAVRLVDMNRDGSLDVVTVGDGDPGARVYFGDGEGRFPRNQAIVVAGAREATTGDLDGDGADDLVLAGDAARLVAARGGDVELTAEPLELPPGFARPHVIDADGDARADLVGLAGGGVAVLAQVEPRRFEARPLVDLPLAAGTIVGLVVAPLGGGERFDLALLVDVPGDARGVELVLVMDPEGHAVGGIAPAPVVARDAPLSLQVDLR